MKTRKALVLVAAALTATVAGCGSPPAAKLTPPPSEKTATTETTAATPAPKYDGSAVAVNSDLMTICKVSTSNVETAPKFDFDNSALLPQDREVLAQIAKCVTTGPLKGRALQLVGRADARGETEYNFALGEHRAGTVQSYLVQLGVDKAKLAETSRGKLDATGTDEAGWEKDRRVDLLLQ